MMTSGRTLATAALTDAASRASAMMGSAPKLERDVLESCERTIPQEVCPASVRLLISGRPMAPVAPATKTLTAPPEVRSLYCQGLTDWSSEAARTGERWRLMRIAILLFCCALAAAGYWILRMLQKRQPVLNAASAVVGPNESQLEQV